jgi:hypothetical protein
MPLRASDQYNNSKVEPWLVAGARELTQTKKTEKQGAPGKSGSKISCRQSTWQRQEVGWRAARKIDGRGVLQALRPAATEEVFCSKPNLGPQEKKAGPRKINAEPENQQVQAHEKNCSRKKRTRAAQTQQETCCRNWENRSDVRPKTPTLGTGLIQEATAGPNTGWRTDTNCPNLPQEDDFWPGIKVKNKESNMSFNQLNYPGFTASHSPK